MIPAYRIVSDGKYPHSGGTYIVDLATNQRLANVTRIEWSTSVDQPCVTRAVVHLIGVAIDAAVPDLKAVEMGGAGHAVRAEDAPGTTDQAPA